MSLRQSWMFRAWIGHQPRAEDTNNGTVTFTYRAMPGGQYLSQ